MDEFAKRIKADTQLAKGFNCIGFSQGNSLCRGYVKKYNGRAGHPSVVNVLSVHGTISGVAGFPNCDPEGLLAPVCKQLAKLCGDLAYTKLTQDLLFQIDYFRDPTRVHTDAYRKYSQIAEWNGESYAVNATYKENMVKVASYSMIKAEKDTMVYPNEGEWWGHFADGGFDTVVPMRETTWYKNDTFGLQTLDLAGKLHFNTTSGNHLQFSKEELGGWIKQYFV